MLNNWIVDDLVRTRDIKRIVGLFDDYLKTANSRKLYISGFNKNTLSEFHSLRPITHRWSETYRKKTLRKFYKLENHLSGYHGKTTMMTLTCRHSVDSDYLDFVAELQDKKRLLLDLIRHKYKKINYVWVMEPHKNGFPHIHVLFFGYISAKDRRYYSKIWSDKYGMGTMARGCTFSIVTRSLRIASPKNYLMKYINKGFSVEEDGFKKLSAIIYFMGLRQTPFKTVRMWGSSRAFASIMKSPPISHSFILKDVIIMNMDNVADLNIIYENLFFKQEVENYIKEYLHKYDYV